MNRGYIRDYPWETDIEVFRHSVEYSGVKGQEVSKSQMTQEKMDLYIYLLICNKPIYVYKFHIYVYSFFEYTHVFVYVSAPYIIF